MSCTLTLFCFFLGYKQPASAQIFGLAEAVRNQPSLLTREPAYGLFTSIANAGNRLVAVGQDGRIVLSDNDGHSWRQVETPTSVLLTRVSFISSTDGWAVGQMGVILHTVDGGEHWVMEFDGSRANEELVATAQADASAKPNNPSSATNVQNAQQFMSGGPSVPFLALLPLSADHAVVAGGFGMAFETYNGGASWRSVFDQVPNPNGFHIYSILNDGTNQLWVGEQGLAILRDASGNFTTLTTPFQGTFFGALRTRHGAWLLFGLQGTILRSTDEGKSWARVTSTSSSGIDNGLVLSNGDILLGGVDGSLLLSHDEGLSFSAAAAGEPVVGIAEAKDNAIVVSGPLGIRIVPETAFGLSE